VCTVVHTRSIKQIYNAYGKGRWEMYVGAKGDSEKKKKTQISTIRFLPFPACTILKPLRAASVSAFSATH